MSDVRARLGARLRDLRRARRLTQESLAERAGLSYKFIGEIERGLANPTIETIGALSDALGIEIADLFARTPVRMAGGVFYDMTPGRLRQVRESLETVDHLLDRIEGAYAPAPKTRAARRGKPQA